MDKGEDNDSLSYICHRPHEEIKQALAHPAARDQTKKNILRNQIVAYIFATNRFHNNPS